MTRYAVTQALMILLLPGLAWAHGVGGYAMVLGSMLLAAVGGPLLIAQIVLYVVLRKMDGRPEKIAWASLILVILSAAVIISAGALALMDGPGGLVVCLLGLPLVAIGSPLTRLAREVLRRTAPQLS